MRTALFALAAVLGIGAAGARSGSHAGSYHAHAGTSHSGQHVGSHGGSSHHHSITHAHTPKIRSGQYGGAKKATGVARDAHGKIKRSAKAKDQFRKTHPCPSTDKKRGACPGYVIDHVQALKHGGSDSPGNMQWQSDAAAKAKDKVE